MIRTGKAAGLYTQARQTQTDINASNNRDEDVLDEYDIEEHRNTYDNIVLTYTDRASEATDAGHTIDYYNTIISDYENDTVPADTKARLLAKNEEIFSEIRTLSTEYSEKANLTIDELFHTEINEDLQYLIIPEVNADKPVKLIAVFMTVLAFGLFIIAVIFKDLGSILAARTAASSVPGRDKKRDRHLRYGQDASAHI